MVFFTEPGSKLFSSISSRKIAFTRLASTSKRSAFSPARSITRSSWPSSVVGRSRSSFTAATVSATYVRRAISSTISRSMSSISRRSSSRLRSSVFGVSLIGR